MKTPTNKLSIYLLKEEYYDPKDILKDLDVLESRALPGVGTFYYGSSFISEPSWKKKFFGIALGDDVELRNASSKAILLISIDWKGKQRKFALAFGYGWQHLNHGVCEERFGLKTTLNIVNPEKLRKIDKKNMSVAPKDTSEQLTKTGIASDFGIDIEQDLIRSITGETKYPDKFGKSSTGKDALSLSVKVGLDSIKEFLSVCLEMFESDGYKKEFGWIDQIAEVKDKKVLNLLNDKLVECLKKGELEATWMAVPEVIEWEHVSGFKYSAKTQSDLQSDLDAAAFLASLSDDERNTLDIEFLKRKTVYAVNVQNDEMRYRWNAYSCIYTEQHDDVNKKTFLLSNGKWFEIAADFAQEVNESFTEFRDIGSAISLPACVAEKEGDYNIRAARDSRHCLMDKKMIVHGGGYSKIEFCDLYTKHKKIIHIKHYGGSSVLSHLFNQGLVSGELFLRDVKFREKVNAKLEATFKLNDTNIRPIASDYEIVFGIISTSAQDLELPFFSKVSLRSVKNRLETFGYKVSLIKILNQQT